MRIISNYTASKVLFTVLLVLISLVSQAQDPANGEKLYKQNCTACHKLDKKLIGPPLNEALVNWDGNREAMYTWVRNWQDAVDQGYDRAIAVESYDPSAMNLFPQLDDAKLDDIWAYIDNPNYAGGATQATDSTPTAPKTGWASVDLILIFLLVLFTILSLILSGVVQNVRHLAAEKQGIDIGERVSLLARIFNKKVMVTLSLIAMIVIGVVAYNSAAGLGRTKGYQPEQPIKYSHKLHAGTLGIDCQYCHTPAAQGKQATIPAVNVCMNCHKSVAEGTMTGTVEIQKIYDAAGFNPETLEYDKPSTGPIEWVRIHNLPDHVYFNHSQHVTVGKIECQTCHGPIEEMEEVQQNADLSMGWCIDCHRNTKVQFTENAYYDKLFKDYHNKLEAGDKDFFVTVEKIGGTECQKCHY